MFRNNTFFIIITVIRVNQSGINWAVRDHSTHYSSASLSSSMAICSTWNYFFCDQKETKKKEIFSLVHPNIYTRFGSSTKFFISHSVIILSSQSQFVITHTHWHALAQTPLDVIIAGRHLAACSSPTMINLAWKHVWDSTRREKKKKGHFRALVPYTFSHRV